jgi:hypothetical protein
MKKQAFKKSKLISIPKQKIEKMTKGEVLKQIAKAEYETVFTSATWDNLNKRLDQVN